jgi:hypothetical protein
LRRDRSSTLDEARQAAAANVRRANNDFSRITAELSRVARKPRKLTAALDEADRMASVLKDALAVEAMLRPMTRTLDEELTMTRSADTAALPRGNFRLAAEADKWPPPTVKSLAVALTQQQPETPGGALHAVTAKGLPLCGTNALLHQFDVDWHLVTVETCAGCQQAAPAHLPRRGRGRIAG